MDLHSLPFIKGKDRKEESVDWGWGWVEVEWICRWGGGFDVSNFIIVEGGMMVSDWETTRFNYTLL